MSIEAMKQALEALEDVFGKEKVDVGAINGLRQAIEQAEQQAPVAFVPGFYCGEKISLSRVKTGQRFVLVRTGQVYSKTKDGYWNVAEQRLARLHLNCQVQIIEDKPAVKTYAGGKPNYCTPVDGVNMTLDRVDETAKGEHEPVGYINGVYGGYMVFTPLNPSAVYLNGTALYLAPPKRKWVGLTDAEIAELRRNGAHSVSDKDFMAIEAKLREKNT